MGQLLLDGEVVKVTVLDIPEQLALASESLSGTFEASMEIWYVTTARVAPGHPS